MISVIYQIFGAEDPFAMISAADWEFLASDYAEVDGEAAVNDLCEDYCSDVVWGEEFGADATNSEVLVVVSAPESIKGAYNVELTRVVKARASAVTDPREAVS